MNNDFRIAVLNPKGRDPQQLFPGGASAPGEGPHPPVNYHAFAACTHGGFYRRDQDVPGEIRHVVLLLRRDLKACRQALLELRRSGRTVVIVWKEAGAFQIAELLAKPARLQLFREIAERAHGAIATTPDLVPLFNSVGVRAVEFIPTPYPMEDPRWDFSTPVESRRGIFVGTREFHTPSRRHLAALMTIRALADPLQEPVTVFNTDGWTGRRLLDRLRWPEGLLRVIDGRIPYPDYLKRMARHKLVWQLDVSGVPGQVAGDALLCRMPCVGGDGTTERLVFPDLCGHGRSVEQLYDIASRLLEHPHDCASISEKAVSLAQERISYERVAAQLADFFHRIS
ncbi:MAG TPA: hypothetical protein VF614_02465 [Chthoniobacteraceae bacterium]|jgi:hypothetical protein